MRVGFGRGVAIAATALLTSGCFVQAGFAGEGNVLYLVQDTSPGSTSGQSFQSDQHLSINSSIGARQSGADNSASITIDSSCTSVSTDCGYAALTQNNDYQDALDHSGLETWQQKLASTVLGFASNFGGNSATVSVTGEGTASVKQYGFGNEASVSATDASGSINQIGVGNTASLEVSPLHLAGTPGSVALNQIGLNNTANLVVLATAGTSSSYTQVGSGLSYGNSSAPMRVTTTTSVDIVQTKFGTLGHW